MMKLDNFFVSGANEEAVAMAEAVLNNVKAYSPVLIYAKPGRGKTHLLHEIQDKCKSALAGQKVAFTTGRQFLEEVDRTIRLGAKPNQIKIYDDVDILLSDLEEFSETASKRVFTNLFLSSMNEKKKQILCTSSVLAKECGSKEMIRFFDRACMVQLYAPDEQLKQSIVEKMAQQFMLNLNEEAKRYIIAQPFSSINQILGDMTKLAALVEENQQVDQQLCQKYHIGQNR
ncbi:MAG: DnaA ATPase domain-containing protein [[Ruminococcus] torques]